MRFTAGNALTIVLLLAAWSWFLHGYFQNEVEWSAGLAVIGALIAIFAKEPVSDAVGLGKANSTHDKQLFEKFLTDLPMQPTIQLLKEHDFGGSFDKESIQPLFHFVHYWSGVDHEFKNRKIERDRKKLHAQAKVLAQEIARGTAPIADGSLLSVFSDSLRAEGPRPDHVIRDAKIINERADAFVPVYEAFVRKCRDKIAT